MATYYVSATTGNDSNGGTAVDSAKATIGAAEDLATSAGDIVYIAPGTYRETVTHGYSGTSGNRIFFIGDPDCEIFGNTDGLSPGVVRITTTDADNLATDTQKVITTNGKDYITWKNVSVDGGSGGLTSHADNNITYGFHANAESDEFELINCMAQGFYYGAYNIATIIDCCFISYFYAVRNAKLVERSVAISAYSSFFNVNLVRNSVSCAASIGIYNCDKAINNSCLGGSQPIRNFGGDFALNNFTFGSSYGFYGGYNTTLSQNGTHSSSYCHNVRYISNYGKMHGIKFGNTQYQWTNNRDPVVGKNGSTDMQGDGLLFDIAPQALHGIDNIRKLADVVHPNVDSTVLQGGATENDDDDAGATDFLGNPRKMGSLRNTYVEGGAGMITSSRDIGAIEYVNLQTTASVSSSQPGLVINDEGVFRIPLAVSGSTSITASVSSYLDSGLGSDPHGSKKPRIELVFSETNVTASATSTLGGDEYLSGSNLLIATKFQLHDHYEFGRMSVSASIPNGLKAGQELNLILKNNLSGSNSNAIFSDLEIT